MAAGGDSFTESSKIDPWTATTTEKSFDYDKLIERFGCSIITHELKERIERITGKKLHRFLRRGLFYCHRDLDLILNAYESGKPFYLYTGRGPSSKSMHLGHLIPFMFTQYLQEVFDVPVVIQLTDDEKFLCKDLTLDECRLMARENVKDIIACGFKKEKTFIFTNTSYIHRLYPNILKIQKHISQGTAESVFGFGDSTNIGLYAFPAVQAAPSFSSSFPVLFSEKELMCLIPQAIDQDPYFRLTRDVAPKLKYKKPVLIHSSFLPSLAGTNMKMSSTSTATSLRNNCSIFLSDTDKEIETKIRRHAFSGAPKTLDEHREKGADLEIDVSYQYLRYFLEDDDELEHIKNEYSTGKMLTSTVKERLISVLTDLVKEHRKNRDKITDEIIGEYMRERVLL